MSNPTDSFFGGAPALAWPKANNGVYDDVRLRGVSRGGLITKEPELQQMTKIGSGEPLWWDQAQTRPKMQMIVTLLCDGRGGALDERVSPQDKGERRLYIRGYMVNAVREALQRANAEGLRVGGELYVAWIDEQASKTKGFDPARLYAAKYVTPTVSVPDGGAKAAPAGSGAPANPYQQAATAGQQAPQQPPYQASAYVPPAQPQAPPWEQPAPSGAPAGPPPATPFQQPAPAQAGPAANPYA